MFKKAERKNAKLRMGLVGSAGSGKTYSALLVAQGLGKKIAVIDTENGSAELYSHICDYDVCAIEAPYTVDKYIVAIDEAERLGYDVIIIDSLTHAWAGDGGLLDKHGKIADSGKTNSFAAWRTITPLHNKLVETILQCKSHVIATMRAKTEYVLQEETNKFGKTISVPKKIGMAPVQRDGMDYEFTLVFDVDCNHNATASKDRTSLFDGNVTQLGKEHGETLKLWLESGKEPEPKKETPKRKETVFHEVKADQKPEQKKLDMKSDIMKRFYAYCNEKGIDDDLQKRIVFHLTDKRSRTELTEKEVTALMERIIPKGAEWCTIFCDIADILKTKQKVTDAKSLAVALKEIFKCEVNEIGTEELDGWRMYLNFCGEK